MNTTNMTFMELITDYTINIPIIQRDYAQGRSDEKNKRDIFLDSIFNHLTQSNPQNLDFIYGRISDKIFFPIDGQQRLTTLFLIHWYMSIKADTEENNIVEKNNIDKLIKFVYDTRISSREFCKAIVIQKIVIPAIAEENNFILEIKENHWFRNSWRKDPTINAMLIMIQAIHEKFHKESAVKIWKELINERIISFQMLDLGAKGFELTDELYIKMNARGKQLTPFENFKANFIQLIDKYFKNKKLNHPIKGEISYSGYFSYKIEKEWTDLFWAFRGDKTTIDNKFYSYFEFVSQMCFFKTNKDAKVNEFINSLLQYEDIFKNEENLMFLFDSLDKLHEISTDIDLVDRKNVDIFFNSIKSNSNFFWNPIDELNLFDRIITNVKNEDPRNKILLYCILNFTIKFKINQPDESLMKYVRVIRNLLQATRQRNETKYITNIRINNFGSYWLLFEQLLKLDVYSKLIDNTINNKNTQISDPSLKNEVEKAKILLENNNPINDALIGLEEFEYFEGLIHLLKPVSLINNYPNYLQHIKEIFDNKISSSLKIRALISCDFGGVYIKNCRMGEMWYFGKNHNWLSILTTEDNEVSTSIIKLLNEYSQVEGSPETRLNSIIDSWQKNNTDDRSWKHYFINYPEFTSKLNYYVWPDDFQIRLLGTEGSNPLVAYHISPFVLTICDKINDKIICNAADCYLQYSGHSPLILKNGLTLTSIELGWLIENKNISLSIETIERFNLDGVNDNFILKEFDNRDRIELAIDFIAEVKNL